MNNFNRNTRTLIVCFLVAVFALIPLRFVEVGQQGYFVQSQVLGDTAEELVDSEIVSEVAMENVIDCISQEEFEEIENQIYVDYMDGKITEDVVESLLVEMGREKDNICQ